MVIYLAVNKVAFEGAESGSSCQGLLFADKAEHARLEISVCFRLFYFCH